MRLSDRMRKAIDGLPGSAAITLPVETIEEWLDVNGSGLEPDRTVEEVGEFFGRSRQTVCRWIRQGRLEGYKFLGNEYRITESAIEEFQSRERLNMVED